MNRITRTYYQCRYCGLTDTDESAMRKHESICKGKENIEDMLGKWVKLDDSSYFRMLELKPLSETARGIRMTPFAIETYTCYYRDVINKPLLDHPDMDLWDSWKKAVEGSDERIVRTC